MILERRECNPRKTQYVFYIGHRDIYLMIDKLVYMHNDIFDGQSRKLGSGWYAT